jgi:hypothetical protein
MAVAKPPQFQKIKKPLPFPKKRRQTAKMNMQVVALGPKLGNATRIQIICMSPAPRVVTPAAMMRNKVKDSIIWGWHKFSRPCLSTKFWRKILPR